MTWLSITGEKFQSFVLKNKNHLNANFWNELTSSGNELKIGDQAKIIGKSNTSSRFDL